MSDHLPHPDCIVVHEGFPPQECVFCDALRACEARVRGEYADTSRRTSALAELVTQLQDDLITSKRDALDAARDAVAALPWKVAVSFGPIDCDESCEHGPCTCSGVMRPEAWMTGPADVRAAIDALRGESDG